MTNFSARKPSLQAAFRNASDAQPLADTDLAGIVGGVEACERRFAGSTPPGVAMALPFSSDLQQLPVGASEADAVPWSIPEPAVKKIDSAS